MRPGQRGAIRLEAKSDHTRPSVAQLLRDVHMPEGEHLAHVHQQVVVVGHSKHGCTVFSLSEKASHARTVNACRARHTICSHDSHLLCTDSHPSIARPVVHAGQAKCLVGQAAHEVWWF